MLACGHFYDFVLEFIDRTNEDTLYDVWMHKVFTKSYNAFRDEILNSKRNSEMSDTQTVNAIKESQSMLANFNPNE